MKRQLVAVEIGNDWLKILEARPSGKGNFAFRSSFTKLAQISGPVSAALAKAFREMGLKKSEVIIFMPRHLVTVRILDFPSVNPKEIGEMVSFQVGKQTPYSKEEIVSAHKIVGSEKEGYTKVILVIAKSSIVKERLEVLRNIGIQPRLVGLSTEGVCSWFNSVYTPGPGSDGNAAVIVLDIDSNYSDFIVMRRQRPVFTRSILIGVNHLLLDPAAWKDKFIEELVHSLQLYRDEEKEAKVSKLFLTGSSRQIEALDSCVSSKLDLPVEIIGRQEGVFSVSALLGGIASRQGLEIDLSGAELRIQRMFEEKRRQLTLSGALAGFIVTLLSIMILMNVYNKRAYLSELKNNISGIEAEAKDAERARAASGLIAKRLDTRGSSIDILKQVCKLLPAQVYLSSLDIDEADKIILKGRGQAMSDVFNLVTIFEKSRLFKNVKNTYTATKKEDNTEFAEFEITANIQRQ